MAFFNHKMTRCPFMVMLPGNKTRSHASVSTGACVKAMETSAVMKLRISITKKAKA